MRVTLLHSRIRVEERLLLDELERRGIDVRPLHADETVIELTSDRDPGRPEILLDRCLSHTKAAAIVRAFEAQGVECINPSRVIETCGDKLQTTAALARAGVPSPRTLAAFSYEGAVEAAERLGYPLVLKPTVGSWGRMVSKINDRDALDAVLEHKAHLGGVQHGVIYLQELINKPGRDIRAFVVGDETICAIVRHSEHWITNTARGGRAEAFPVTDELNEICVRAAHAVGGGVVAIDLLEDPERGLLVNEINSTMEFKNSIAPTGVDIPARIVDFVLQHAHAGVSRGLA